MNNKNKNEDKRKYVRVEYNLPVIIETSDMTIDTSEGTLMDISASGVMFESNVKLHVGLLVRLKLKLKKELAPLVGYIQWQKEKDGSYLIGLKLDETLSQQNDRVIDKLTQEIINEFKENEK